MNEFTIITRNEALKQGLEVYFTGKKCKHGHLSQRCVKFKQCLQCRIEYSRKHYADNKEKYSEYAKNYRENNRDTLNEYNRQWARENPTATKQHRVKTYEKNKESRLQTCNRYYAKNRKTLIQNSIKWRKKNRDKSREISSKWQKNNRGTARALTAKRRAKRIKATPHWLSKKHHEQIKNIYQHSRLKEQVTNTPHHVDHIVPLNNPIVCGLHVPWNLQVLSAEDNLMKSNKLLP